MKEVLNFAELFRRTNAPFAIDKANRTRSQEHILRPCGIGSIEYVVEGRGTITENKHTFQVKAGDVFILHPGQFHDYYPDPDAPWHRLWVQISGFGVPEVLRMYGLSKVNHIPDFDISEDIAKIRTVIGYETDPEIIDRYGPGLMCELCHRISKELERRNCKEQPSIALQIRTAIDSVPDGSISLDQLAKEFHITKQHVIRVFKQEYGITPHEYILDLRVGISQSLLKRTHLTVQEIAIQLNFCDAAYFSEFFRKRVGMTPLEFRKKYK